MDVEKRHSELGASTCHRWWECPGSVNLIRQCPEQEPSIAAATGTAAHELAEWALKMYKEGKKPAIYSRLGDTVMVDNHEIEITEEMIDAVDIYLKSVHTETYRLGTGYNYLEVEEKFNLDIDDEAWGTNDAFLYKPFDCIYLWDYKHGKGVVVEVKNNKQLMYYALGAIKNRQDVEKVVTRIVQPRAYHPDGPIRECVYTVAELKAFEIQLKIKIEATKEKNAPLKTGPHCKFCPAISECPEVREETYEVAKADFPSVSKIGTKEMAQLVNMAPRIVDFLKEVEQHLKNRMERGESVSGFKLVKAKSNRIWKSEARVIHEFRSKLGDSMFKMKLLSPAQLEKAGKDVLNKDELLPYIEKPDKGLTLVKDSDPRPAVKTSAVEDFKLL